MHAISNASTERCIAFAVCGGGLLLMLWLLKGTRLLLVSVELLSTVGPSCSHSVFWNDLSDPLFDGVVLSRFKSSANAYLLA